MVENDLYVLFIFLLLCDNWVGMSHICQNATYISVTFSCVEYGLEVGASILVSPCALYTAIDSLITSVLYQVCLRCFIRFNANTITLLLVLLIFVQLFSDFDA